MQHTDGRRRGRRRISVAVLTTAMTLAAVRGRHRARQLRRTRGVRARAGEPRTRELRRPRPRRRRRGTQRTDRACPGRARAPFGHAGRDRVGSADRHAQDGRPTGRLPDGTQRAAPRRPSPSATSDRTCAAFGLTKADLKTFRLRQDYVDIAGVHHISWTQSKRGVPVFHNGLRANVTSDGRLVNITGSPVHAIRVASAVPSISVRRGDQCGARRRRRDASPPRRAPTRRRSCCSRRDAALGSRGRRSPGRTRSSSTCRSWTRQRVGAVPAEPDERRHRNRDGVGVLPERPGARRRERGEPRHVPGRRRHEA